MGLRLGQRRPRPARERGQGGGSGGGGGRDLHGRHRGVHAPAVCRDGRLLLLLLRLVVMIVVVVMVVVVVRGPARGGEARGHLLDHRGDGGVGREGDGLLCRLVLGVQGSQFSGEFTYVYTMKACLYHAPAVQSRATSVSQRSSPIAWTRPSSPEPLAGASAGMG